MFAKRVLISTLAIAAIAGCAAPEPVRRAAPQEILKALRATVMRKAAEDHSTASRQLNRGEPRPKLLWQRMRAWLPRQAGPLWLGMAWALMPCGLLQAALMELTANPARAAEATVIEAKLDKGKGPLATVLINRGTLKVGDILVVGTHSGRVRAMLDDKGRQVKEAPPALPVEVLGLGGVPMAGDTLTVVESEARAREVALYRHEQATAKRTTTAPASLENMFSALKDKQTVLEYPVVIKADVQGSAEAIVNALNKISNDEIKVKVLNSGVGAITEGDVSLAFASGAPVIGFNVRPNAKARELVERHKVRMKYFDVIYHLTEDVAKEMAGIWGPERIETVVGRAEIKEVFPAGKKDKAAGLLVTDGYIRKGLFTRVTRNDVIVSKTHIASLRRFKDDVAEVRAGLECGVVLQDTNDIKPGDMLETFEVEMRERTL